MNITAIRHPQYNALELEWKKFRLTYKGGRDFIDEYLEKFSKREDATEFLARKSSSYCPAHAKTAVNEIKDAISERLVDVVRIGGAPSYERAVDGLEGGVDNEGSTMNGFISLEVLPELLSMGKVGVYIDKPDVGPIISKADENRAKPYLYTYTAEDIFAWDYNDIGELKTLLLRDSIYDVDKVTQLPKGIVNRYRYYSRTDEGIVVKYYDKTGKEESETILNLAQIPFVIFEIRQSLLTDIADHQIALLNLGSSDLSYAIKANFPFYTEQYDPREFATSLLLSGSTDDENDDEVSNGTSTEANTAKEKELRLGANSARRYPKGVERPGFVHPSSEPITASMQKQADLRNEIRELTRLAVKSLASSSADTKKEDSRSVESGLASIGAVLERSERKIAEIWSLYDGDESIAIIKYPDNYTLRTDAERREEAKTLLELMPLLPSDLLKKEVAKQVANILVSHRLPRTEMADIEDEIEGAEVIIIDPEEIRADQEKGLVGTELASRLRGYPEGEVEKAEADHMRRIERIALSQSKYAIDKMSDGAISTDMVDGARGVQDLDTENDTAKKEKEESRNTDLDDTVTDKTRGEGK